MLNKLEPRSLKMRESAINYMNESDKYYPMPEFDNFGFIFNVDFKRDIDVDAIKKAIYNGAEIYINGYRMRRRVPDEIFVFGVKKMNKCIEMNITNFSTLKNLFSLDRVWEERDLEAKLKAAKWEAEERFEDKGCFEAKSFRKCYGMLKKVKLDKLKIIREKMELIEKACGF